MGNVSDFKKQVQNLINEMEDDTDYSRSQSFLEEFWRLRSELEDARYISDGKEREYSKLLNLLNRKGEEYDLEPY